MTTIAYKDGVMAADTLVSNGDARMGFIDKIGKVPEAIPGVFGNAEGRAFFGALYGTTGAFRDIAKVNRWACQHGLNEANAPKIDCDTTILMISADGQAFQWEGDGPWSPFRMIDGCIAIGSGAPEARGALLAGATALQAVEIAAKLDANTLGPFQTMALDTAIEALRPDAVIFTADAYAALNRPTKVRITPRIPETD